MDRFSPQDISRLESLGELLPPTPGSATRQINRRHFDRSSSSAGLPADFAEIPAKTNSKETFEYLGFSPATAESLEARLVQLLEFQPDNEDAVLDLAKGYVENRGVNAYTFEDDWAACLEKLGINEKLSNAIRTPGYEQWMCKEPAVDTCVMVFELRWQALVAAQEESRARACRAELG